MYLFKSYSLSANKKDAFQCTHLTNVEQEKIHWDRNIFNCSWIRIPIIKETLVLWCIYMTQLITHVALMQEMLTMKLFYKPFGILQLVTKN